jgi:ribonuclease R
MQDHVGEEFDGTISGVTSFGLFVTLDGLAIDGLVHITELGRDYFHFDAGRHALVGERSGVTYQLAGRIRVKGARVDLEQAKIDFVLGDQQPAQVVLPRPVFPEPLSREDRPRKAKARR